MSAELGTATADWSVLCTPLREMCAHHEEFEHFSSGVFMRLTDFCAELVRRQETWARDRQEMEARLDLRAEELRQERVALDEERKRVLRQSETAQIVDAEAEDASTLRLLLDEAETERAALRAAQELAQSQAEQLARLAEQLAATQRELSETRSQLELQREKSDHDSDRGDDTNADLRDQLSQWEHKRSQWQQERVALETELDAVRNRVAELAEALSDEKRSIAEERSRWTGELKRMRHLLEALPARQPEADLPLDDAPRPEPRRASSLSPGDPVLDSVVAQFAMLQKDAAQRRNAEPKTVRS